VNRVVEQYIGHVEFPEVSGAEHLAMLQLRDRIQIVEESLTADKKRAVDDADRRLIESAGAFHAELARFINFEERRKTQGIPPSRWWWYLDVLAQLPNVLPAANEELMAT